MNNEAKYLDVFMKLFEIGEEEAKALKYQDIPAWDSIGHMSLINELEETFNISMDADDIMHHQRLETQLKYLEMHPDIDVLGSRVPAGVLHFSVTLLQICRSIRSRRSNIPDTANDFQNHLLQISVNWQTTVSGNCVKVWIAAPMLCSVTVWAVLWR